MDSTVKLALIDTIPFWFDGVRYSTTPAFIKFVLSFKEYFDRIVLIVPITKNHRRRGEFYIEGEGIDVVPLPSAKNDFDIYLKGLYYFPLIFGQYLRTIREIDIAWIVTPHFPSVIFWMISMIFKKNVFLWIRGDYKKDLYQLYPKGPKRILAALLGKILMIFLNFETKRCLTFVTGHKLLEQYQNPSNNVYAINPSIISVNDILPKRKCSFKPKLEKLCLLNVGRLTPEKGLEYLIKALPLIIKKTDIPLKLTIVGGGRFKDFLGKLILSYQLSEYVKLKGYLPFGPELLNIYTSSDIFILPSHTEGIPKTLYEAMARGVPIVATSVGGVPDVIRDEENGLLIPPANTEAIAEAVLRLVNDEKLRGRLVKNGLETVKEYTIEKQMDRMINILESHFGVEIN